MNLRAPAISALLRVDVQVRLLLGLHQLRIDEGICFTPKPTPCPGFLSGSIPREFRICSSHRVTALRSS